MQKPSRSFRSRPSDGVAVDYHGLPNTYLLDSLSVRIGGRKGVRVSPNKEKHGLVTLRRFLTFHSRLPAEKRPDSCQRAPYPRYDLAGLNRVCQKQPIITHTHNRSVVFRIWAVIIPTSPATKPPMPLPWSLRPAEAYHAELSLEDTSGCYKRPL